MSRVFAPYDSPTRVEGARRTRLRILEAAHAEMAEHGYGGTTMRAIAARAGVSVKTVEAAFATKANLLKQLIDVRVAGDDEPVAMIDRPAVAEMIAEPDVDRLLELNAAFVADITRRIVVIDRVAREAAPLSEELTALFRVSLDNRRRGAREFVEVLATRGDPPGRPRRGRRHRVGPPGPPRLRPPHHGRRLDPRGLRRLAGRRPAAPPAALTGPPRPAPATGQTMMRSSGAGTPTTAMARPMPSHMPQQMTRSASSSSV